MPRWRTSTRRLSVHLSRLGAGVAAFVVGALALFVRLVLLGRRFRVTTPMVATVMAPQVILLQALQGFSDPGLVVLGVLGTGAVCVLAMLLKPRPSRPRGLLGFAALGPPVFWGVFLCGVELHDHGLGWKPEIWGGALVWSGLGVAAVALALAAEPLASTRTDAAGPRQWGVEGSGPRADRVAVSAGRRAAR